MASRRTADTHSSGSSLSGSSYTRSENLLSTDALRLVHRQATEHLKKDGQTQVDPLEVYMVALWEDLYQKVLLKGYSNNSQAPPNNQSENRVDIITYYFDNTDDGFKKMALVYTEAKRASNATSTTKGKTLLDLEGQLFGYCEEWLKAKRPQGGDNQLYANAVVGPYIRFFTAKYETVNSKEVVVMRDHKGKKGYDKTNKPTLDGDYYDVGKPADQVTIRAQFKTIRDTHKPEPVSSRPGTSSGSAGFPSRPQTPNNGSERSPQSASPMEIDQRNSPRTSPPRESRPTRPEAAADRRSASPRNVSRPVRQRTPPSIDPNARS